MDSKIRRAKEQRLYYLRLQEARMGYSTPVEVLTEIEDIQNALKKDLT